MINHMTLKFHAPTPLNRISESASTGKAFVAVPFLGKNAAKYLPITSGSVLVTRFNGAAIKSGQVDPTEVIKFLKRGVHVYNYDTLHAKVYVLGKRGFVGSANVSRTSQLLSEACIETNDPGMLSQARKYVESLTGDLITPEYAKSLVKLYPKDGERSYGAIVGGKAKAAGPARSKLWVVPVSYTGWPEDVKAADRKAAKTVQEKSV